MIAFKKAIGITLRCLTVYRSGVCRGIRTKEIILTHVALILARVRARVLDLHGSSSFLMHLVLDRVGVPKLNTPRWPVISCITFKSSMLLPIHGSRFS
jgi:hypothetical protein